MPRIRTLRTRKAPPGWDLIEPTLEELNLKMRDAERETHDGKRKCESVWPIFQIHHQRSRFIFEQYYVKKEITQDLFDFCCQEGYADKNLIAMWKRPGFEKLCCLKCIQTSASNFGTTCICRVVECVHCGCRGCSSGG